MNKRQAEKLGQFIGGRVDPCFSGDAGTRGKPATQGMLERLRGRRCNIARNYHVEGSRDFQFPKTWRDVVNFFLGLWLILSPWILGFETHIAARNSTVVAGILVAGLALWAKTLDIDMRRWMHEHHLTR